MGPSRTQGSDALAGATAPRSETPRVPVPRLAVTDVTSSYIDNGARLTALAHLSLSLGEREFVAVIGPSGSGKSTLLDIIAGLLAPDSGDISFAGQPLSAAERLGRSAYMRQRDLLLPWRSALDNAALALEVSGTPRQRARAMAADRLDAFGLSAFAHSYPAQLSGGMRQRVALARTVLAAKSLYLLDEPFGALDALTRIEMQSWWLDLWERDRSAVLLVTHDIDEAIFMADRVLVMTPRPGRLCWTESIDLPRPRVRAMVTDATFIRHKESLLSALGLIAR